MWKLEFRSKCKHELLCVVCMGVLLPTIAHARPKPDLYPNQHLKAVGQTRADRDIIECQIQAEDYEESRAPREDSTLRKTGRSAVGGAALGALAGTITGAGAGRGAGAGAAVGGIASLASQRKTNRENEVHGSPAYQKYVEACLSDQGYRVVGWR